MQGMPAGDDPDPGLQGANGRSPGGVEHAVVRRDGDLDKPRGLGRRALDIEAAAALRRELPPLVAAVALLMDADREFIAQLVARVQPDLLQFHGSESPDLCRAWGRPYIKSVAMAEPQDLAAQSERYADASALLLDGHQTGELGGQGTAFDWSRIAGGTHPLILAGGLKPDNVASAIGRVRPYAVDVSSGIESAPGLKDAALMQKFIEEVRRADAN